MAVILSLDNQNAEFYYKLALEQLEAGTKYEAILNLIKAVELDGNPAYKMDLAEAYYNTHNYVQSTNLYIKLFFSSRKFIYVLAIYRNLLRMEHANLARNFILNCFQDLDSITTDIQDELPDIDEVELHKVMGAADGEYAGLFARKGDDDLIAELRMLVSRNDYDDAIMTAMDVPTDSTIYDIAQEVICVAAHARGDDELALRTARELLARQPSSVIAFGVLAMAAGMTADELQAKANRLYSLIKSKPDKVRDFLRALSHLTNQQLFDKYIEEAYAAFPYVLDIIALKMFDRYANGDTAGGDACLKRLQMLFPDDFCVRAYTAASKSSCPPHCWQEYKYTSFCTFDDCIEDAFYDFVKDGKGAQQANIDAMCAMILNSGGKYIGYLIEPYMINKSVATGDSHANSSDAFLEGLLSDINISPQNKCDLIYAMLLFGWDSVVDIVIEDVFLTCKLASLSIIEMPIKLARMYCEVYIKMLQIGEEPCPDALEDTLKRMQSAGIKYGMKQEALLAVLHYIYELDAGNIDEKPEYFAYLYEANPKTVQKYIDAFQSIIKQ